MKLSSALVCAALCSIAFAGCGGDTTASHSSAIPNTSTSSTGARYLSSMCTPDSYGYCVVQRNTSHVGCSTTYRYELYYYGTDEGSYAHFIEPCSGDDTWNPGDPADVTGDPNLP